MIVVGVQTSKRQNDRGGECSPGWSAAQPGENAASQPKPPTGATEAPKSTDDPHQATCGALSAVIQQVWYRNGPSLRPGLRHPIRGWRLGGPSYPRVPLRSTRGYIPASIPRLHSVNRPGLHSALHPPVLVGCRLSSSRFGLRIATAWSPFTETPRLPSPSGGTYVKMVGAAERLPQECRTVGRTRWRGRLE